MEMRGADAGTVPELMALPAFWAGLLYDRTSLAEASALTKRLDRRSEVQALRDEVPRLGLKAPFRGGTVLDVAREAVAIADSGLKRRGLFDFDGDDERKYLAPLLQVAAEGRAPADRLLDALRDGVEPRHRPPVRRRGALAAAWQIGWDGVASADGEG